MPMQQSIITYPIYECLGKWEQEIQFPYASSLMHYTGLSFDEHSVLVIPTAIRRKEL